MKIPKINPGHKVYVIYDDSISLKSAAYIGQYSFIVGGYEYIVKDAREWSFDDYGTTWFTSFEEAKKFLLQDNSTNGHKGKIVKITTGYWEFKEDR